MFVELWIGAAWAVDGAPVERFADTVCTAPVGPPRGALAIAKGPLGWVHSVRRAVHTGKRPAPGVELLAWLPVRPEGRPDAPVEVALSVARAPRSIVDGEDGLETWVVVAEARAWRRPPVIAPNLTVVVDVSESMATVHTRKLPVLHRATGEQNYAPIDRMDLAQAVLFDLVDRLPDDARVSLVAMDTFNARMVLPPTSAFERAALRAAITSLETQSVGATDPASVKVLQDTSARTFDRCHDNRVILFTDHVAAMTQRQAIGDVKRWADDDVELWSFGLGLFDAVNAQISLLEQTSGGAAWLMNTSSDGEEIWSSLLDPGGVVARDVSLRLDFPPGAEWREVVSLGGPGYGPAFYEPGDMASGQPWSRVYEVVVPEGSTPDQVRLQALDVTGARAVAGPTEALPFEMMPAEARTRALGAWWIERPDDPYVLGMRDVLPAVGHGTELRAWMAWSARQLTIAP